MESKRNDPGRYDEARKNLQLHSDESLDRVWKLSCIAAAEIRAWQGVIQEERARRSHLEQQSESEP